MIDSMLGFELWLVARTHKLILKQQLHFRAYNLALATYVIVVFHYLSEWLVYKTTKMSAALASPMIVGSKLLIPQPLGLFKLNREATQPLR